MYIGRAVLKKHYNNLLLSLQANHTATLERFLDAMVFQLSDDTLAQIVSSTNSKWANTVIFNLVISTIKNDYQLLALSFLMEILATGEALVLNCPNIESFRNG